MSYYGRKTRTARKQWTCSMCFRKIEPGERYMLGFGVDGGDVWNWRECAHCDAALQAYDIQEDYEYGEGDFEAWVDRFRSYPIDMFDPAEVRAAVGYTMRWRTPSGQLFPIPAPERQDA